MVTGELVLQLPTTANAKIVSVMCLWTSRYAYCFEMLALSAEGLIIVLKPPPIQTGQLEIMENYAKRMHLQYLGHKCYRLLLSCC